MNRIVLYYIAAFLWGTPGEGNYRHQRHKDVSVDAIRGYVVANAHLRRIPIHIKSKKDRLLSSRSFSLISLRTLYPKNEMSTPAATAEPMTPEMLDAIQ